MTFLNFFLLLFVSVWFLTGVILLLHRISPRAGLFPLTVLIGGLTATMQLQVLGLFQFEVGGRTVEILAGNYFLLPVILMSLLIVYVTNGSIQARVIVDGIIIISGLVLLFGLAIILSPFARNWSGFSGIEVTPRLLVAQALSLTLAILIMFVGYQSINNIRIRIPSRLAGGTALLIGVLAYTLIFHLIYFGGSPYWWQDLGVHLSINALLALVLWPLLIPYLLRVAPKLPDTVADLPRPAFDFLITPEQLESRSQFTQSLLRTISQINQLIVHSSDADDMLQQACEALVNLRKYHMVWIGILDENTNKLNFAAQAGLSQNQVRECVNNVKMTELHLGMLDGQAVVIDNVSTHKSYNQSWQQMMLASGCRAAATFPMRSADQILGSLNIGLDRPNSLAELEVDLLQDLADDLAYAMVSLEARSQQATLQTAAETMQDGLLIADLKGKIVYVNSMIAQITGRSAQEIIGEGLSSLISAGELETDLRSLLASLKEKRDLSLEFVYQTSDHRKLDLVANASLVKNQLDQPLYIVFTLRDNTQWRKYEDQLLALNRLTGELVQIYDTHKLMEAILHTSEDILDADASGIYLVDQESMQIIDTLTHNLSQEYSQRIARDYRGLPGDTARKTLQPAFVEDTLQDETYGERIHFMAEYGIRALIILPVLFQERPFGALTLYYNQPHTFTPNQLQIGRTLTQTLAIVIQNARLYQGEQEQRKLAEALTQAAASLSSSLDLENLLDQILEQMMKVIPCKSANILMLRDDYAYVRRHRGYEHIPNFQAEVANYKIPTSTFILQQMLANETGLFIPDTSQHHNWEVIPGSEWIKGYAGSPLKVDGEIVGFLNVESEIPDFFTEGTIYGLQIFADHAAAAIKNARLYQAEQEQRKLAEALTKAAATLTSSLDLEDLLDRILEQVMNVIPCKAANILMIRDDHVYVRRHRGYEQFPQYTAEVENIKIPISTPNIQYMLTNNEGLLIPDTTKYPYWEVLPGVEWIKGYAGNPLKVDGEIVGFLSIDSDTPDFFTEDTIYGLKIFADYASAAIKNARAFESSIRRTEEMAALVAAASTVSRSLDYIQVLQVVAEQMANTLGVVACAISDYDPEANQVTLLLEHRPDGWDVGPEWYQPFDLNEYPITRQVLLDHKPVHLRNDDPDLHESERQFMEKSEIGSLLLLPLVSQDRTLGLVELMDVDKDREFSEQDIALGLSLASHAAIAIENADLYRRLQDHASTLEERVQQRTQELQEATDYIEGILASVPDAVFVLDQNQQLIRANQSGQLLLEQAQTTGLNLFNPKLLDILEDGGIPDMQSILEVQERAYQALSSQLITDDGTISGQIIVFRDVTTFRELDQMKTQFVSDVSHELRTPLTNLTLYLGLLTTVRDPQKQNEYILTLQRETDRLAHLIEDLLTISRLEASRIQFQIRATNLNQLVEDLILDRTILATQKNIELNFTPGVDLPLVSADVNMLTQALSNLLTNATNYTLPDGKVQVSTDHPEPDWITIQIADTGVGIPSDEIERVFDRFYRGSASQHTGAAGTGLGLAIAQEIIHRLGGKITLKTNPGEGSAFTVWLKPAPEDLP